MDRAASFPPQVRALIEDAVKEYAAEIEGGALTRSASSASASAPAPPAAAAARAPAKKTKAVQRSVSEPLPAPAAPAPLLPKKRAPAQKAARPAPDDDEDEDEEGAPKAKVKHVAFSGFELALQKRIFDARNPTTGVKLASLRPQLSALRGVAAAMKEHVPLTSVEWVLNPQVAPTVLALKEPLNSRKGKMIALSNVSKTEAQNSAGEDSAAWEAAYQAFSKASTKLREQNDAELAKGELSAHQAENFIDQEELIRVFWRPLEDQAAAIAASTQPEDLSLEQFLVLRNCFLIAFFVIIEPSRNKALAAMNTQKKAPAADDSEAKELNWLIPNAAAPELIYNVHKADRALGQVRFAVDAPFEAPFRRAMKRYIPALYAFLGAPEGSDVPLFVSSKGKRLDSAGVGKVILDATGAVLDKRLGSKLLRVYHAAQNTNLLATKSARGLADQAKRSLHGTQTRIAVYAGKRLPGDEAVVTNFRQALADVSSHIGEIPTKALEALAGKDTVDFLVRALQELQRRDLEA